MKEELINFRFSKIPFAIESVRRAMPAIHVDNRDCV